ncbi:hypothetical protein AO265_09025, partial [Pseudomonas sp. ABAC61]
VDEVSSLSRNTQGVTLIKLADDETLVGLERVQASDELEDVLEEGDVIDVEGEEPGTADEAPQE